MTIILQIQYMLFYPYSKISKCFSPPFNFYKQDRLTAVKINQEKTGAPRNDLPAGTTRGNKSLTRQIIYEILITLFPGPNLKSNTL